MSCISCRLANATLQETGDSSRAFCSEQCQKIFHVGLNGNSDIVGLEFLNGEKLELFASDANLFGTIRSFIADNDVEEYIPIPNFTVDTFKALLNIVKGSSKGASAKSDESLAALIRAANFLDAPIQAVKKLLEALARRLITSSDKTFEYFYRNIKDSVSVALFFVNRRRDDITEVQRKLKNITGTEKLVEILSKLRSSTSIAVAMNSNNNIAFRLLLDDCTEKELPTATMYALRVLQDKVLFETLFDRTQTEATVLEQLVGYDLDFFFEFTRKKQTPKDIIFNALSGQFFSLSAFKAAYNIYGKEYVPPFKKLENLKDVDTLLLLLDYENVKVDDMMSAFVALTYDIDVFNSLVPLINAHSRAEEFNSSELWVMVYGFNAITQRRVDRFQSAYLRIIRAVRAYSVLYITQKNWAILVARNGDIAFVDPIMSLFYATGRALGNAGEILITVVESLNFHLLDVLIQTGKFSYISFNYYYNRHTDAVLFLLSQVPEFRKEQPYVFWKLIAENDVDGASKMLKMDTTRTQSFSYIVRRVKPSTIKFLLNNGLITKDEIK